MAEAGAFPTVFAASMLTAGLWTQFSWLDQMQIVYDEVKRLTNLNKHGLDFAELESSFFDKAYVETARNGRLKVIGRFRDGLIIAAIVKPLGSEALSVISMRPANIKELRKL